MMIGSHKQEKGCENARPIDFELRPNFAGNIACDIRLLTSLTKADVR